MTKVWSLYERSYYDFNFYKDLTMLLVQIEYLETDLSYGPEILHQCGKSISTKSQKILRAYFYVCTSYRGKTGMGLFCPPS